MSELLPCPFCGWSDPSWHVEHFAYDFEEYAVHCGNCDAESAMLKTREEAAAAWNRRTRLTAAPAPDTREALAEYAHDAWSGWMEYLFSKCDQTGNTYATIPTWAVRRWQRQMNTPYADLPEEEKESDRLEADRIIEVWDKTPGESGRAEPPMLSGWYWWDGTLDGRRARGLVNVNMPSNKSAIRTIWPSWCDGWFSAEEMPGQWYGPVLPPWKEEEP
jgi:Lar family restriction alleviation protein